MLIGVTAAALALAFVVAPGCDSTNAVVGGSCAAGYSTCGSRCVDTASDPEHCGACFARCAPGVSCSDSVCGGSLDGAASDGSLDGSATDGDATAMDGSLDGAGMDGSEGEGGDACGPPPYHTPAACGACGIVCTEPTPRCKPGGAENLQYACAPACTLPLVDCGGQCVDLSTDPVNCGACGKFCPSNVCVGGVCQGSNPGDIVVIGHDYSEGIAGSSQAKVLTNAVFIPQSNPLRILSYEQFAEPAAVANVKSLLQSGAAGRTLQVTVTTTAATLQNASLAKTYDVVIIYDQQTGTQAQLAAIGAGWQPALQSFAKAGGVVVALDGAAGQGAMPTLLTSAGLLDVPTHQAIAAGSLVGIVAPADAVGSLVVSPYGAFKRSVTLQTIEPNGGNVIYVARQIVAGAAADPVVIHKIVP